MMTTKTMMMMTLMMLMRRPHVIFVTNATNRQNDDLVPFISDSRLCEVENSGHVFRPVEHLQKADFTIVIIIIIGQIVIIALTIINSYPCVQLDVLLGQDGALKQEENLEGGHNHHHQPHYHQQHHQQHH